MMQRVSAKTPAIITAKWLWNQISTKAPNMAIVDGSWHMPHTKRVGKNEYTEKHLPGAVYFDIDSCADETSTYGHMLPKPEAFASYVGKLGIDNNTHVVVYDNNEQFGLFSAQRVWWTFRVFGHSLVSVLDGGLGKWTADGYATTATLPQIVPKTFHAVYQDDLVKNYNDIQDNFTSRRFTVLDARSEGRFNGTSPEPREGIPSGHMSQAINIPFTRMLDSQSKTMKSEQELADIFSAAGVDFSQPLVASCGTGVSACMLALAAFRLDKPDIAVYDGSWTEFAQRCQKQQIITS